MTELDATGEILPDQEPANTERGGRNAASGGVRAWGCGDAKDRQHQGRGPTQDDGPRQKVVPAHRSCERAFDAPLRSAFLLTDQVRAPGANNCCYRPVEIVNQIVVAFYSPLQ